MRKAYVGCYFRVWMPKQKTRSSRGVCLDCKEKVASLFCPACGRKIVFRDMEMWPSFYDYSQAVFDDGDKFYSPQVNNEEGYMIILGNEDGNDHVHVDDKTEYEMPQYVWSDDWLKLGAALDKDDIKYEAKFGIVTYWE